MLITVVDAAGAEHLVVMQGQDQINDFSGVLGAPAVGPLAAPQQIAPANVARAGFLFQNVSANSMLFFEDGNTVAGWILTPGEKFPFLPNYPIPTGAIFVQGTGASVAGDAFVYRDWQTAVGE